MQIFASHAHSCSLDLSARFHRFELVKKNWADSAKRSNKLHVGYELMFVSQIGLWSFEYSDVGGGNLT